MSTLKKSFYSGCYFAALAFLIGFLFTAYEKMYFVSGSLLALFFLSMAIAFRGSPKLKGYWYSVLILAVATVAMYFPQYFRNVGGRDTSFFIPILLQVI